MQARRNPTALGWQHSPDPQGLCDSDFLSHITPASASTLRKCDPLWPLRAVQVLRAMAGTRTWAHGVLFRPGRGHGKWARHLDKVSSPDKECYRLVTLCRTRLSARFTGWGSGSIEVGSALPFDGHRIWTEVPPRALPCPGFPLPPLKGGARSPHRVLQLHAGSSHRGQGCPCSGGCAPWSPGFLHSAFPWAWGWCCLCCLPCLRAGWWGSSWCPVRRLA